MLRKRNLLILGLFWVVLLLILTLLLKQKVIEQDIRERSHNLLTEAGYDVTNRLAQCTQPNCVTLDMDGRDVVVFTTQPSVNLETIIADIDALWGVRTVQLVNAQGT